MWVHAYLKKLSGIGIIEDSLPDSYDPAMRKTYHSLFWQDEELPVLTRRRNMISVKS